MVGKEKGEGEIGRSWGRYERRKMREKRGACDCEQRRRRRRKKRHYFIFHENYNYCIFRPLVYPERLN